LKRAEAFRRRLLSQGRKDAEKVARQTINLMKKDIQEIMNKGNAVRVGSRMLSAMEMCEERGKITSTDLYREWPDQHQSNCRKYLDRAVVLGFMTRDNTTYPHTFRLVDGWKERIYGEKPRPYVRRPVEARPTRKRSVFAGANSIFNLAA
jgi:hypothetical protein